MRLRVRLRAVLCLAVVVLVSPLGSASSATAVTVDPATGPDFEMPFPCGAVWTGSTRSSHRPSPRSIDFNRTRDLGDLTVSSAPGVVSRVADTGSRSYGKYVIVDHGDGESTLHAHLRSVWTTQGQRVDQGTVLGTVGESGGVTGAHLHFEQRRDGDVHQPYFHRTSYAFGSTSASLNCPDVPLAGDWNADGVDDVAVFRRGSRGGAFRLSRPGSPIQTIWFGRSSDQPIAGDWDGDGRTDVGVRRPGRRSFLLRLPDGSTAVTRFGFRTDVAVTGDWDGDGTTEVGAWRPSSARFRLLRAPGVVTSVRLGSTGSVPVTGDWNADRRTDLGVFDPATATFRLRTTRRDGSVFFRTIPFGTGSALPTPGDWDGDGRTDLGMWNPRTARFALRTTPVTQRVTGAVVHKRFGLRRR